MLLWDGRIADVLAENVTKTLQTLDLPLHVLSVLLFYRYRACILYFDLKHLKLGDTLFYKKNKKVSKVSEWVVIDS